MFDTIAAIERLKPTVLAVGAMQKARQGQARQSIDRKTSNIDLVTEVDLESERMLVDFIRENFPDHAIFAEEGGSSGPSSDYLWVIDPLDGTTNYVQGLPIFAVSVALKYREERVLGIVYTPVTEQLFTAARGHGAYLNGEPIAVSPKRDLGECVLATGFPYDVATHPVNNLNYFSAFIVKTRAVRRIGVASYDLACVAAGKFDGYWEMSLSPYDMMAGALLVEEAGGEIRHFRRDRGISLIAGSPAICDLIQAEIAGVDAGGRP